MKLLLELGTDIEGTNTEGWTALHGAAEAGYVDVVGELLNNGVEIEARRMRMD